MPRVRPPQSDSGQVHLLATTLKTAAGDTARARGYLPPDLVADIGTFLNDREENGATVSGYATLVTERAVHEGRVTREIQEAQIAEAELETHLRDYIVTLARRTYRMKHSVAVLDFHRLGHGGEVPVIASREDRRTLARQLVAGDAAAIAAGFPAMANPAAAELQQALDTAVRETDEIIPADRELQALVGKIRLARPRAAEFVQEVLDELRHATRRLEPGTARDIMRSYGVSFEVLVGEIPAPGEVPAAPDPAPQT